ncbi:regulator of chromosome condensation [Anaeramoeba ignava]|uniref:Regulator of chromosome condensation n=1 Tax=Anaeramoeba ignava TaxID=1746090 RepID=A0A9Q0LJZ1_ANAIG|nr:regulator of chromosome condensation [Anaeramoeba ignava]
MNEIIFFGLNKYPKLIKNKSNKIKKPIQFKFENENENENENEKQIKQISSVTVGVGNEAILTIEGNVFAKGEDINPENPKEFINISSLIEDTNDRIIQDIVSGRNSIYLLTSNQNAYGIGLNKYGQLGLDSLILPKTEKPILMMKNVSKIFSGNSSDSVLLLNSNQELFGCGYNLYGQLGLGESRKETKIHKLTKIQNIPKGKIIDIQFGFDHSIMLIEDENENPKRKLYSCGYFNIMDLANISILMNLLKSNHLYLKMMIIFLIFLYKNQSIPIQIELPKLRFNENISNYHISCEEKNFVIFHLKPENGEIIEAHKLILKYRLNQNQNQIEKLKEIISKKSIKESNQIFEMIYSNNSKINPKLYSEIKEIINSNEKIEETIKRIYLNENENEKDFIIERKEKQYKFPKLILIMRSELYRGMFLSVTNDKSNKVTDYSELSNKSFQIFEYWIYSNQIKEGIQITQEIINEIQIGIDYFQLNQTNPNLFDLLIKNLIIKIKIKFQN